MAFCITDLEEQNKRLGEIVKYQRPKLGERIEEFQEDLEYLTGYFKCMDREKVKDLYNSLLLTVNVKQLMDIINVKIRIKTFDEIMSE